jgi:uracil-DNA glycosylase family protein
LRGAAFPVLRLQKSVEACGLNFRNFVRRSLGDLELDRNRLQFGERLHSFLAKFTTPPRLLKTSLRNEGRRSANGSAGMDPKFCRQANDADATDDEMRKELKRGKEADQGELILVPAANDLAELGKEAAKCQACPLFLNATQTVFGEGGSGGVVFIGEQPGDQEDRAGKPFVGPAGQILDQALKVVRIDRSQCYVTNAVKHFKWKPSGKRRIHEKPNSREIEACRPWLIAELQFLRPEMIVCLGASAVRSAFGKDLPILKNRGHWTSSDLCPKTLITVHPSSILRAPDPAAKEKAFADFVADLNLVTESLGSVVDKERTGKRVQ